MFFLTFHLFSGLSKKESERVQFLKSEKLRLEVKAVINCASSNATRTEWRFWGGIFYNESVSLGDDEPMDTLNILIAPRTLGYGK